MEPPSFPAFFNFDLNDSPVMEPKRVVEELLAVEAAEYIPSPNDRVELLLESGQYEAAASAYRNQPASHDKEALFKTMAASLYEHADYYRTWPILFGLVEPQQKHAFMLNLADGLLGEKKGAFDAAKNKVAEIVTKAECNRKQQREEINKRRVEAIDACSNVPALSQPRQIVKIRQREWHEANETLLQASYNVYIDAMKDQQLLQEPNARRDSVTITLMHPVLQEVRQIVTMKKREFDEAIHVLFQEAVRLQIPHVWAILYDIEAKEQLLKAHDSSVEQAVMSLYQKKEELGAAYEKVRYMYRLLEHPSWQKALETKMLANLTDMEQRGQFSAWLNRPS